MTDALVLRFGASREQLQRAERKIDELAERRSWPEDLCFKVKLVVEELSLNIIDYGYNGDESKEIEIRFRCGGNDLTIEFIDKARAFNPLTEPPVPDTSAGIEERSVGGLGVHLVRGAMDEARYVRQGNCNRLTLKTRLAP